MHTPTYPTAFIPFGDPRPQQYTTCSLRTPNIRRTTINLTTHPSPGLPISTTLQPRPTRHEPALRRVPTRHKLSQPQTQKSSNTLRSSRTAPPPRPPTRRRSRLPTNGILPTTLLLSEPTNATHQARTRRRWSNPPVPRPNRLSPVPIRLHRSRSPSPRKRTQPRNAIPKRRSAKTRTNSKPILGFRPPRNAVAGPGPVVSFSIRGETGFCARLAGQGCRYRDCREQESHHTHDPDLYASVWVPPCEYALCVNG